MEKFEKVKELIAGIEADATKFYDGGNGAAGTRVRGCCATKDYVHHCLPAH